MCAPLCTVPGLSFGAGLLDPRPSECRGYLHACLHKVQTNKTVRAAVLLNWRLCPKSEVLTMKKAETLTLGGKCAPEDVDPLVPTRLFLYFATLESLCVLRSHPEGDRPENSVPNEIGRAHV